MIFTHFSINLAMSIKKQPINIFQLKWLLKLKINKCTLYLCASQVKLLNDFCYLIHPCPPVFLGKFSTPRRICIQCIRKNTNQHFHVIFFQITCRTQSTGGRGAFLRPISHELCYIYLPIHIHYPSSKIHVLNIAEKLLAGC